LCPKRGFRLDLVTEPDYLYQLIVAILADPDDPVNLVFLAWA